MFKLNIDNDKNEIKINQDKAASLNERRTVRSNVFFLNNKIFILRGNNSNNGE